MAKENQGICFTREWLHELQNDIYSEYTPQEIAYIMYAAAIYGDRDEGEEGERIDIGEVFGKEFKGLNRVLNGYCGQIDRIKKFAPAASEGKFHFDAEKVKELAAMGKTAKEILIELGYPLEKEKSLASNTGWKEGKAIWNKKKKELAGDISKSVPENTEIIQNGTESVPDGNIGGTENKSVKPAFNF